MIAQESQPAEASPALAAGRLWMEALNKRDAAALEALLSDDFLYSAMVKQPPEMAIRWDKATFLAMANPASRPMSKPVAMTVKSEMGIGDRAVIETEGYSEHQDGYVYANVYCFLFWTKDGKLSAVHDYCCTHTAVLYGEHMRALATADAAQS